MEQVAILARVSTQGQDYERQVVELTDYCQLMNWKVVKVFANKVSGSTRNADREEISGLVELCQGASPEPGRMPRNQPSGTQYPRSPRLYHFMLMYLWCRIRTILY